jgi:cyanophycinase
MTARSYALLGSGEFDPWSASVDRWLVGRPAAPDGPVLIFPTASAAEGDDVFEMWAGKGLAHYRQLGIDAEVVPLKSRDDARDPAVVASIGGAAAVYFSGGNPAYLAATLQATPAWDAIVAALDTGTAYAGCSAGVACLGDIAPDSSRQELDQELFRTGLRLFPRTWFGPHWDALDGFAPGLTDFIVSEIPTGVRLVGIDENTAMVGDGHTWETAGVGAVHVMLGDRWTHHEPGEAFELGLGPVAGG